MLSFVKIASFATNHGKILILAGSFPLQISLKDAPPELDQCIIHRFNREFTSAFQFPRDYVMIRVKLEFRSITENSTPFTSKLSSQPSRKGDGNQITKHLMN